MRFAAWDRGTCFLVGHRWWAPRRPGLFKVLEVVFVEVPRTNAGALTAGFAWPCSPAKAKTHSTCRSRCHGIQGRRRACGPSWRGLPHALRSTSRPIFAKGVRRGFYGSSRRRMSTYPAAVEEEFSRRSACVVRVTTSMRGVLRCGASCARRSWHALVLALVRKRNCGHTGRGVDTLRSPQGLMGREVSLEVVDRRANWFGSVGPVRGVIADQDTLYRTGVVRNP